MTGIEFKDKVNKYLTDKKMSVWEHENLCKQLKSIAFKTFKKIYGKYCECLREKYDTDCLDDLNRVKDVEFNKNTVDFSYWDYSNGCRELIYFAIIPLDDFANWIDNDVSDLNDYVVNHFKELLINTIEQHKTTIARLQVALESDEEILAKIDKMKFNGIKKMYDEWIDNMC